MRYRIVKRIFGISLFLVVLICLFSCETEMRINCSECGKSISSTSTLCEICDENLLKNDRADTLTNEYIETTNDDQTDITKDDESEVIDQYYEEYLVLLEAGRYKDAYESIGNIKDDDLATELRRNFVIIEDVLLSKTLKIPDDKFGNKIGPFNIDYFYDDKGNLIEIDANSVPIYNVLAHVINHFMCWTFTSNYTPYHEELAYDSNNRITRIVGYFKDTEKIIYTIDFFYDKQGNNYRIEQNYDGGTAITLREYNDENQLIKVQGIDGGTTYYNAMIPYDEQGNILEEGVIYNEKGQIIETKFTYMGEETVEAICEWNYGDYYIYNG